MPEPSPTLKRRGRLLRIGAALVVLLAVAGYLVVQYVTGGHGPGCKVVSGRNDGEEYEFTPEQAVNAATIAAVGTGRGMSERAVTIALATSLQESGLRNIQHGDRDSLGLFQQRPSQGWGKPQQILDPTYAAGVFYEHLAKVPDYQKLPLTVAAQRVQRSGFPEAYAKHEPDAELLAAALTGHAPATLTCQGRPDPTTVQAAGPDAVRAALVRDFGRDALQPAGAEVSRKKHASTPSPATTAAAASGTRTVTVPVAAGKSPAKGRTAGQRGWQVAHWAVANATALHIERVSFGGREWTAGNTDSRWRTAGSQEAGAAAKAAVRIVTGQ
ncbi:heavy metal transporter [Streptomyces griseorubiginosus]|uniref:heavy metal transporter n=1 Tax=Streptomyces griseorubiginosus TaxID=67304 RepID=UPI001AD747FD|nr:heavy metal transporter [Streptomyces griseorubiginosus]MBO4256638.1 heavy metal transporter [Streptomyces griseorubiginosus]